MLLVALDLGMVKIDPEDAPNASAREEVTKLNLSLEMGDNVMIYLDDIQHCNPEFLQKFISLCDAQRKIEGVWRGKPKTYDMRGRRVVVVMAGELNWSAIAKGFIPDFSLLSQFFNASTQASCIFFCLSFAWPIRIVLNIAE